MVRWDLWRWRICHELPNPHDRLQSKRGRNLASLNKWRNRIEKGRDSRGCVVVANNDLKDISTFIELETSIIIVEKIEYLKETWIKKEKN